MIGVTLVTAVSVGREEPGFGVQLARAAPAAIVAVSLRNVRREIGGRRFMLYLRIELCREIPITTMRWLYYKRDSSS
jgi:hypothetical protein